MLADIKEPPNSSGGEKSHWIETLQKQGFRDFKQKPFPSSKEEDWKYTDPRKLLYSPCFIPQTAGVPSSKQLSFIQMAEQNNHSYLVFVNGYFSPEFSRLMRKPHDSIIPIGHDDNGSFFISFKQMKKEFHLKKWGVNLDITTLMSRFENKESLEAFNQGCFQDGGIFILNSKTNSQKPIHIIDIITEENVLANSKYYFYSVKDSETTLFHSFLSTDKYTYLRNDVLDAFLEEGSKIKWLLRSNQNSKARQVATIRAKQMKNSRLDAWHVSCGCDLERINWRVELLESNAECSLRGVYALKDERGIDHTLKILHQSPHTTSHQLFKGIIANKSQAVFNGLVKVAQGAYGSRSSQKNKSLLLDKKAQAHTRPQLIIHNDDVQCTHGATVGQIEEEELFYLKSRGLSHEEASSILSRGFLENVLSSLPLDGKALSDETLKTYFD